MGRCFWRLKQELRSRPFLLVSSAGFLSFFGMVAVMVYYPLLMQGIQGMSALRSGQIITPLSVLMAFLGVPTGFLLARSRGYRWMFLSSYALLTLVMFGTVSIGASTPGWLGFILAASGGTGWGMIPTLNTVVTQAAVPRRLLGVATGALFFSICLGQAVAPAVLGSALNIRYRSTLEATLPAGLARFVDTSTRHSLADPKVLFSEPAMRALRGALSSPEGRELLGPTVAAIRVSLAAGLKAVFLIGALAMLGAFALISTIPEVPVREPAPEAEPATTPSGTPAEGGTGRSPRALPG